MKLVKIFSISLIIIGAYLMLPLPSFAVNLKIIDYHYDTHFIPGEKTRFSATVKNNEASASPLVNLSIILTNIATGVSIDPAAEALNNTIFGNTTSTIETADVIGGDWKTIAGLCSVSISILDTSTGTRYDRVYGTEPVHVGTAVDSVAAFPRVLDLGALQYGRYMHPVPIEISWSFFGYSSQIRKDHPWYMRIYTDNHRKYRGIDGAVYSQRIETQGYEGASAHGSFAGLVSSDGKYTIPLKIWCLNFGPDVEEGWDTNLLGPPPVKEDYYWKGPLLDNGKRDYSRAAWARIPDYTDMSADPATWRRLIGQDPYDTHYVSDSNPTGDFTLTSPFQAFIAYETSPASVMGKYSTDLILEIYSP
ncbi:MAG: hypothetical protein PHO42_02010 [Candidatus Omnitrophica bacterium]|nr:hypothetical protein [Candidatus Omnitrophota bacterium]